MLGEFQRYKITYSLIGLNIFVYLLSSFLSRDMMNMDMRVLVELGALYGPLTVLKEQWWRLFTAMFLHGGMTHILMNMVSLYIIGRGAEMYFDTKSYLSIYLFSGLLGGCSIALYASGNGRYWSFGSYFWCLWCFGRIFSGTQRENRRAYQSLYERVCNYYRDQPCHRFFY